MENPRTKALFTLQHALDNAVGSEMSEGLYLHLSDLTKQAAHAKDTDEVPSLRAEIAVLQAQLASYENKSLKLNKIATDCAWVTRGEGRYLQKATKRSRIYKQSGATADRFDNFTDWQCGMWNGVLGASMLMTKPFLLTLWKKASDEVRRTNANPMEFMACAGDAYDSLLELIESDRFVLYEDATVEQRLNVLKDDEEQDWQQWPSMDT
jgi:hypothetical protein